MIKIKWLNQDNFLLGALIGLLIPVPLMFLFGGLLRLVQVTFDVLGTVRDIDMLLLGLGVNVLVMRYYLINLKSEKTGKGILLLTVIMILLFFLFLKNSNFAFPF
jgi:hypothetical protein